MLSPGTGAVGIAFGRSGKLYVALALANQISVLNPDGTEAIRLERFERQGAEQPP